MPLYLKVPYGEKDKAEALGAEWDEDRKQWYVANKSNYKKFLRWYPYFSGSEAIICDWIYIVRTRQKCPSCNKNTNVISLAVENHFGVDRYSGKYEYQDDHVEFITVEEEMVDRRLENYLKRRFNFFFLNRPSGIDYYANHCWECGAVQDMDALYMGKGPFNVFWHLQPSHYKMFRILLIEDGVLYPYFTDSKFLLDKNRSIEVLDFKINIMDL